MASELSRQTLELAERVLALRAEQERERADRMAARGIRYHHGGSIATANAVALELEAAHAEIFAHVRELYAELYHTRTVV